MPLFGDIGYPTKEWDKTQIDAMNDTFSKLGKPSKYQALVDSINSDWNDWYGSYVFYTMSQGYEIANRAMELNNTMQSDNPGNSNLVKPPDKPPGNPGETGFNVAPWIIGGVVVIGILIAVVWASGRVKQTWFKG